MNRDLYMFYYWSTYKPPEGCWLDISENIAHRNLFLLRDSSGEVHFEFPSFEDHTYNTICQGNNLKSLIKRDSDKDKYILFRTNSPEIDKNIVVGYYKINRAYYQETNLFDDRGYVWSIETDEPYLISSGLVETDYSERPPVCSWRQDKYKKMLNRLIDEVENHKNIQDQYRKETNKLISIFQDSKKMEKWKEYCETCGKKEECVISKKFKKYKRKHSRDMFSVLNNVYNSNLYSKNILKEKTKHYIEV